MLAGRNNNCLIGVVQQIFCENFLRGIDSRVAFGLPRLPNCLQCYVDMSWEINRRNNLFNIDAEPGFEAGSSLISNAGVCAEIQ